METGAVVTDHAQAKPKEVNLVGWVSDLTTSGPAAGMEAMEAIKELVREATPVRVITGVGEYQEMLIKDMDATQRGHGLYFTMKLEEIQRVNIQAAENIVAASGPAMLRTPEQKRGYIRSVADADVPADRLTFGGVRLSPEDTGRESRLSEGGIGGH